MNSPVSFMYLLVPSNATPHVLEKVKFCIGNKLLKIFSSLSGAILEIVIRRNLKIRKSFDTIDLLHMLLPARLKKGGYRFQKTKKPFKNLFFRRFLQVVIKYYFLSTT